MEGGLPAGSGGLRALPAVDALLHSPEAQGWLEAWPRPMVVDALRHALSEARAAMVDGGAAPSREQLLAGARRYLARIQAKTLRPVINAAGVVLHTNLGRAPLSEAAIEAVARVASGYSNLEYDLEAGQRGSRQVFGEELLRRLTGAEAALVVNNNAAAVLLVLAALCRGREVIISRGELIEIGGSFRIPEVMEQSGCILREVGTTNRTHLRDYERAIGEQTAAILKVHTSNYRIEGFTKSVPARELAGLCRARGLLLIEDLGSGVLVDTAAYGLGHEPGVAAALEAGCDVVTFSGDKLLGGPQAGLIVGRADLVAACREHPLARALRVDKMTLAALQATLEHYLWGEPEAVPIWRMLTEPLERLRARAEALKARLDAALADGAVAPGAGGAAGSPQPVAGAGGFKVSVGVREVQTAVGGGSLPGRTLPSVAVVLEPEGVDASALAGRLRSGEPPVVGRVEDGKLLLDLRTVPPEDDEVLAKLVAAALGGGRPGAGL